MESAPSANQRLKKDTEAGLSRISMFSAVSVFFRGPFLAAIFFITINAHADTIGWYTVQINRRVVATETEFHTIRLTFNADTIHISDTLRIQHYGCGGHYVQNYWTIVIDSTSGDTVYRAFSKANHYVMPMNVILDWNRSHPHSTLMCSFSVRGPSDRTSELRNSGRIRFVVRME